MFLIVGYFLLLCISDLWMNVPVVTGLPSNAFLKESSISGSPIDVPFGENEIAESSPSTVKCLHCPKFYSGFDMLKEHIQLCHPERAIGYSCVQCNAAFSNREQLEKHQVLHSPESQVKIGVAACRDCDWKIIDEVRMVLGCENVFIMSDDFRDTS
ncbi:hypothetical protein V9T40_014554 [Parthenolecanium corni]|uniref:C2H2-type domain-containing protein n=1 Tax=Parthenolecanium corni TaxID=536013 RepID=A0AAN9XX48_9HEMI